MKKHCSSLCVCVCFKGFKNNYLCTLAGVSLKEGGKTLTSTAFQKDLKIAKLPSTCKWVPDPSLKCPTGLSSVLRASDMGSSLISSGTHSKCLVGFRKTASTFPHTPPIPQTQPIFLMPLESGVYFVELCPRNIMPFTYLLPPHLPCGFH